MSRSLTTSEAQNQLIELVQDWFWEMVLVAFLHI